MGRRWQWIAVMAVVSLAGTTAVGSDRPTGTAAPGWQTPAESPAAIGTLPGAGAEPAILHNQPEIPGLSGRPGNRQRPSLLLALRRGGPLPLGRHLLVDRYALQGRSPLLLGLGTARLRAPPPLQLA